MVLRKVWASEPIFKKTKKDYEEIFFDFKNFILIDKIENDKDVNMKDSIKGKPTEYPRYLIFSLILYSEIFEDDIIDLDINIIYLKLKKLESVVGFEEFNKIKEQGRFYKSTILKFEEYVKLKNMEIDELLTLNHVYIEEKILNKPSKRHELIKTMYGNQYPRNLTESIEAKNRSNWTCEIDPRHETFRSSNSEKNYIEAHHLLPMSAQKDFPYTIDFADNIVALCPNCHRKIHLSSKEQVKEMIEFLFEKRKPLYSKHGIDIDINAMFTYYKIK